MGWPDEKCKRKDRRGRMVYPVRILQLAIVCPLFLTKKHLSGIFARQTARHTEWRVKVAGKLRGAVLAKSLPPQPPSLLIETGQFDILPGWDALHTISMESLKVRRMRKSCFYFVAIVLCSRYTETYIWRPKQDAFFSYT